MAEDRSIEYLPDYCLKRVLIAGCGNRLFGDDGFGPEVIDYLTKNYSIPEHVCLLDTGTGIRKILFTITLSSQRPELIVIIDAVDKGRKPGDLFEIPVDDIPEKKIDDFSIHQVPSSNMLRELQDFCSVKVIIAACQVANIPDNIKPGLSEIVKKAVPLMAQRIATKYF